jgi:EAL domain-containing protein (putative c-di-GMP-specific phosphodiesterase class I)
VEDIEDLRTQINLGCHTAQGYLFSRPMDSVRFMEMLQARPAGAAPPKVDQVSVKRRA